MFYNNFDKDKLFESISQRENDANIAKDIVTGKKEKYRIFEKVLLKYIKDHRRVIYGGYAQNLLVKMKDVDDSFYDCNQLPDVDFYSENPLIDLYNLAEIFDKKGFKNITVREALHKGTYKLFIEYYDVADVSYVPHQSISKIMKKYVVGNELEEKYKGINLASPYFMLIDQYKILTDPYNSSNRWLKVTNRIDLLLKHYPYDLTLEPEFNRNKKRKRKNENI